MPLGALGGRTSSHPKSAKHDLTITKCRWARARACLLAGLLLVSCAHQASPFSEMDPPFSGQETEPADGLPVIPFDAEHPETIDELPAKVLRDMSYVIDNKRFMEATPTRCLASTKIQNPSAVEPEFVIIRPHSEVRLNATSPAHLIRMESAFDPQLRTVVLIHGFTQSYPSTQWLRRARALFEENGQLAESNLIIMDWGRASSGSYSLVAAASSSMGAFLSNFLVKLIELGAKRSHIHLIGHSLGAHVAGFAGKRLRPRLGRITALDPAGPCFGKLVSGSLHDRLGPEDAYEVDVYHYDDSFLGLPTPLGHFDIYVNGGSKQPGCKGQVDSMLNALITVALSRNRVLSESHTRSTEVATAELAPTGCQQVAYECRDWTAFTHGECGHCNDLNEQCFLMGFQYQYAFHARSSLRSASWPLRSSYPSRRMFISTGMSQTFCQNHYQLVARFEDPETAATAKHERWLVHVDLVNEQNESTNVTLTNMADPQTFTFLMLTEAGYRVRIRSARLRVERSRHGSLVALQAGSGAHSAGRKRARQSHKWTPSRRMGRKKFEAARLVDLQVNFMSNIDPSARRALSSHLCPVHLRPALSDSGEADEPADELRLEECSGEPN